MEDGSEKNLFCLTWNNFEENVSKAYQEIREEGELFDVTLVCDDGQIDAHKLVISACSLFFHRILKQNLHSHPWIYIRGAELEDVSAVLDFMYLGEVNITQIKLASFLALAEDLQVKGLSGVEHYNPFKKFKIEDSEAISQSPTMLSKAVSESISMSPTDAEESRLDIAQMVQVKEEILEDNNDNDLGLVNAKNYSGENVFQEDRIIFLNTYVVEPGVSGKFSCYLCGKMCADKRSAQNHVESKHFSGKFNHMCKWCGKDFATKIALNNHMVYHRGSKGGEKESAERVLK